MVALRKHRSTEENLIESEQRVCALQGAGAASCVSALVRTGKGARKKMKIKCSKSTEEELGQSVPGCFQARPRSALLTPSRLLPGGVSPVLRRLQFLIISVAPLLISV